MKIVDSLTAIHNDAQGPILAIGNFDGVHRGHQAILKTVKDLATAAGVPAAILTFEPHPRKLFRPDDPPFRITPPAIKHRRLKECGIDIVYSLPFDWNFASQSAEDFIANILGAIKPSRIVIGKDFRFGQLRKGTPEMIAAAGYNLELVGDIAGNNGRRYSSTAVREALQSGDMQTANDILGWDWEIEGPVFRGDRRGHDLGYPTANVLLGDTLHPSYGVYATWVQIEGEDTWLKAATNIGIRPMFELKQGQVEAHILDFPDRDIYGRLLRIKPVVRLRGEAKFGSLQELTAQIETDCEQARKILTD